MCGALRELLLNRTPVILQKEIYASAALVAAAEKLPSSATRMNIDMDLSLLIVAFFRTKMSKLSPI
ncbi:MAG: hypothetical protein KA735_10195 [Burkholderiaceae bacterium]|nr:hypothetical protein [Burkholderiaceae bacterium]